VIRREHLGQSGKNEMIILKQTLKKHMLNELDSSTSPSRRVASSGKHGNKVFVQINGGKFFVQLSKICKRRALLHKVH